MAGISPHCKRVLDNFETRTKDVCVDFREIRAAVMCRAWQLMEAELIPFREAIRKAWVWAKDKCLKAGAYI